MKTRLRILFSILIPASLVIACTKDKGDETNITPYTPTPLQINIPGGWPTPVIPDCNPTTVEGVRLGHWLFFDPILSSNGRSCSSCHAQNNSFSNGIHVNLAGDPISIPAFINEAWNPDYGWYGQFPVMDHIPLGDFEPEFFNSNLDSVVYKLRHHSLYPKYFREAFGIEDVGTISHDELKLKISYALIQFIRTIICDQSKFDRVIRHETVFYPDESDGCNIFYSERGDCFHCHGTPLLTNNLFSNNGLDSVFNGQGYGRYLYSGNPNDIGKFSAPSLRNIELTAPYMHDGRFQTLEEVVEFYNSGVHWNSPNIDPIMTKPFKIYGLQLSIQEKADLVAFLKTFTDSTILSNPAYSKPF